VEVLGTGIDLVENDRMRETLDRWGERFKDRVFHPGEQVYCNSKADPTSHYAARFAVKEAVTKAIGTGIGPHIGWLDMEVMRNETTGAPSVRFGPAVAQMVAERRIREVLISLSHTRNYAVAHALLIGESES
jgi:holo-[acyl-carrier protein] synthase